MEEGSLLFWIVIPSRKWKKDPFCFGCYSCVHYIASPGGIMPLDVIILVCQTTHFELGIVLKDVLCFNIQPTYKIKTKINVEKSFIVISLPRWNKVKLNLACKGLRLTKVLNIVKYFFIISGCLPYLINKMKGQFKDTISKT